jgi:membrane protease subunit HflC
MGAAESDKIRANAERQRDTILAEAYRDAQKIKGEGDAKAIGILNEAYTKDPEFAGFYKSLQTYRATFKDKSDVIVLDTNNEFLKYLRNK